MEQFDFWYIVTFGKEEVPWIIYCQTGTFYEHSLINVMI